MTEENNEPLVTIENSGDCVRFGRWYAGIDIRRAYSFEDGLEKGILIEISGGCCNGSNICETLLPSGSALDGDLADAIRQRSVQAVALCAERFMKDLHETLKKTVAEEKNRLMEYGSGLSDR